jgi:hypothetical protein
MGAGGVFQVGSVAVGCRFGAELSVCASELDVSFGAAAPLHRKAGMVKVFGCWPAAIYRLGVGRRTETAHARTRGIGRCLYGDL